MSRGPGRCQRLILEAIRDGQFVYLVDLLAPGYTDAEYAALHRAACTLAHAGRVDYYRFTYGLKKIAIGPAGAGRPDRMPGYDKPRGPRPKRSVACRLAGASTLVASDPKCSDGGESAAVSTVSGAS